ncbi:MAG: M28 family peptidase [Elusimicrobia bacterium]|nr:M28 family peptidase [Elusimicrobiota bacterium]
MTNIKFLAAALIAFQAPPVFSQSSWTPQIDINSEKNLPVSAPSFSGPGIASGLDLLLPYLGKNRPWLDIAANSEQRQPVYLGRRPREIELGASPQAAGLPVPLKTSGEKQAAAVRAALAAKKLIGQDEAVELEGWPARDDDGRLTWAFVWYRRASSPARSWLNVKLPESEDLAPFLPRSLNPSSKKNYKELFADVLEYKDLYQKPLFGDAVWLDPKGGITAAWLPPEERAGFAATAVMNNLTALVLPQPARLDGLPVSYKIMVNAGPVSWPADIKWMQPAASGKPESDSGVKITTWPADFKEAYIKDVMLLAGETQAVFPLSGRQEKFTKKNNIEKDNQLEAVVSYLEERYAKLGIKTRRQEFPWRGAKQANLIAVIPGADHSRPILMADHIDTAFCEDIFGKGGNRVSDPGADDNMSAAAALLRAAEVLNGKELARDIWLVHLTGEEFPADDLGARYFISELLASRTDIGGLVLLDMIGWRKHGDQVFQLSAGESARSLGLAQVALDAARDFPQLSPALRTRFDKRSYLYNTDGLIFSDAGFPVILFNEHINALENMSRKGYHDTDDTSALLDPDYASVIAKIAITTAARLAGLR